MKNWILFLWILISSVGGFILGVIQENPFEEEVVPVPIPIKPEKSVVEFLRFSGDSLFLSLQGDVRVIWADEHFLDESGEIFLSQIPNTNDLQFRVYPFVGNANTGKFYPSTTSWARGVKVSDRRFFETKESAILAGFIPSKSVK
jgi:hypothetical protein